MIAFHTNMKLINHASFNGQFTQTDLSIHNNCFGVLRC